MSNYKLLYVTCKNSTEAKKIGSILVKNKLAACTNIIKQINSIFLWKKKVASSKESILLGKTQKKIFQKECGDLMQKFNYDDVEYKTIY